MLRIAATSLHAAASEAALALCASVDLPAAASAPDWVHLLPGTGEIHTGDGRGPYRVKDLSELARLSLQAGERLPIDENHSTDLAAPRGEPAPARGWIVELQGRQDGLWGRVEWTDEGRRLVEGRAYRGISPVIQHRSDGTIIAVLRASLVNKPNLRGLTSLHQETHMTFLQRLLAAAGLPETTTEDAAIAAVTTMQAERANTSTALQAALDPIALAIGLQAGADAPAVLAGVQQLKTGGDTVAALQAENVTLATRLKTLEDNGKKEKATAFVDAAILAGTVGVKPMRDHYIARHMQDQASVEKEIGALPKLGSSSALPTPPDVALQAEEPVVLAAEAAAYQKKQEQAGLTVDFATAVLAVKEGRK